MSSHGEIFLIKVLQISLCLSKYVATRIHWLWFTKTSYDGSFGLLFKYYSYIVTLLYNFDLVRTFLLDPMRNITYKSKPENAENFVFESLCTHKHVFCHIFGANLYPEVSKIWFFLRSLNLWKQLKLSKPLLNHILSKTNYSNGSFQLSWSQS